MNKIIYNGIGVSWKNTLYNHGYMGHISRMHDCAFNLSYPFFAWNGRIYKTDECVDTGILVSQLDGES